MGALNLWTQNLRFVKIQIERRLFICNAAKAERIQLQEERFGAPGNRPPLVKSLVAKPSLKNKRLNLFGRNTVAVRKVKWHTYEEKGKNGRS